MVELVLLPPTNRRRRIEEHQAVEVSKQGRRFSAWLLTVCGMPRHAAASKPRLRMERAEPLQRGAVARSRKRNREADGSARGAARPATSSIVLQDLAPSKGSPGRQRWHARRLCCGRVLFAGTLQRPTPPQHGSFSSKKVMA